jgi:uncharacterized protein YbjT (DUF2867 family)
LLLRMPNVCYTTKSNYKQTNYEETSYEPGDTGGGSSSINYQPRSKRSYSLQPLGDDMFVITGITGQVGGGVARTLLDARKSVRAVIRDSAKGEMWARQGCEIALARKEDPDALRRAFSGAEAVFVLLPPNFDPSPGFTETRQIVAALHSSLEKARPGRIVCISTIGAQATEENLLSQLGILEQGLSDLVLPITFLRPAWYMENAVWPIFDSQRRFLLGRCSPRAASRAMEVL